jgi:hypothetical protein
MAGKMNVLILSHARIVTYVAGFANVMQGDAQTIIFHLSRELRSCNEINSIPGRLKPWRNWRFCLSQWSKGRYMGPKKAMSG